MVTECILIFYNSNTNTNTNNTNNNNNNNNNGPNSVRICLCRRNYRKLVGCVYSKEDALIQVVRMHHNNINSEMLDTWTPQENTGQHSREDKRKMASEEEAWTDAK
jgi:hypothetical protein